MFRRIFEKILMNRYFDKEFINNNISMYQMGFKNNNSCISNILILDYMIKIKKCYSIFVDLKEAYDSVVLPILFFKLQSILPRNILNIINYR